MARSPPPGSRRPAARGADGDSRWPQSCVRSGGADAIGCLRVSAEITVWRIAADTPDYEAHDLSGKGAEKTGGRWNRKGTAMVYASASRALACLETIVHLGSGDPLPLNRY